MYPVTILIQNKVQIINERIGLMDIVKEIEQAAGKKEDLPLHPQQEEEAG